MTKETYMDKVYENAMRDERFCFGRELSSLESGLLHFGYRLTKYKYGRPIGFGIRTYLLKRSIKLFQKKIEKGKDACLKEMSDLRKRCNEIALNQSLLEWEKSSLDSYILSRVYWLKFIEETDQELCATKKIKQLISELEDKLNGWSKLDMDALKEIGQTLDKDIPRLFFGLRVNLTKHFDYF